jgi:hypothetical protein
VTRLLRPLRRQPGPLARGGALRARAQVPLRSLGGGSVRGSPCGQPARLRFTSLRPHSFGLLRFPEPSRWGSPTGRQAGGGGRSHRGHSLINRRETQECPPSA